MYLSIICAVLMSYYKEIYIQKKKIQSPIFGSTPKRGSKKIFVGIFKPHFFYMFGLIGSIKTFSKVLAVGMNVGPYMAYILYILFFLSFIQKKGFGGPNKFHQEFMAFFGHFDHQNGCFFKARTIFKTIFENYKPWRICTHFQIQSNIFGSAPKRGLNKLFLGIYQIHKNSI